MLTHFESEYAGSYFDLTRLKRFDAVDKADRHIRIALIVLVVMTVYATLGYHGFMALFACYLVASYGYGTLLYFLPSRVPRHIFLTVLGLSFALNVVWITGAVSLWLSDQPLLRFGAIIGLYALMINALTARRDVPHLAIADAAAVLFGCVILPFTSYFWRGDSVEALVVGVTALLSFGFFLFRLNLIDRQRRSAVAAQRKEAERARMSALGRLTGGVAHDFNNMLTVIAGNLELLRQSDCPLDREELILQAHAASQRAADITGQLLAFSRQAVLMPRPIAPSASLKGIKKMMRHVLPADISLHFEIQPDLPEIIVDPAQLETVMLRLCLNAKEAMPAGGHLDIMVAKYDGSHGKFSGRQSALADGDYVQFCVADSGVGISPDVLDQVCEPYFSTKSREEASGLGLAMTKGFVEQSGGTLHIDSAIGVGTRVSLFFPAAADA